MVQDGADKWRAILLIDECDVFLERREKKDIERNAVVSGILISRGQCSSVIHTDCEYARAFLRKIE